jgi:hypothetical protein
MTLALAASVLIAFSTSGFAQGQGRGHDGGPPPGRGGGGGLISQGGGGGGTVAPNFSPRGGGAVVSGGGTGGTYVQGGGTYTPRTDYRRYHRNTYGGWWGPAVGFGIGLGYPYWGGYGYGWDDDYYDDTPTYGYSSLGGFCATRVRTCQLYEAAPVGAPCSCRIPGGRARGSVVP